MIDHFFQTPEALLEENDQEEEEDVTGKERTSVMCSFPSGVPRCCSIDSEVTVTRGACTTPLLTVSLCPQMAESQELHVSTDVMKEGPDSILN